MDYSPTIPTASKLLEKFEDIKRELNDDDRIRFYRAISWVRAAESIKDNPDIQFITLYIAYEAMYQKELESQFYMQIEEIDKDKQIGKIITHGYNRYVSKILNNPYLNRNFWNAISGYTDQKTAVEKIKKSQEMDLNSLRQRRWWNVVRSLFFCFSQLRNQIVHGEATYQSTLNRETIELCLECMRELIPKMTELLMDGRDWGKLTVGVVNYDIRKHDND